MRREKRRMEKKNALPLFLNCCEKSEPLSPPVFPPPRPANPPHPGKSPMVVYGQTKDGKNVQYRNRPSLVSTDIVEG